MLRTSRAPSVLTLTAIMTATDTIRPALRTFTYVSAVRRGSEERRERAASPELGDLEVDRSGARLPAPIAVLVVAGDFAALAADGKPVLSPVYGWRRFVRREPQE